VHIGAVYGIVIGDDVLIGSHVLITDHNHGDSSKEMLEKKPLDRPLLTKGEVIIGNSVWIGENAVILPGSRIGNHCIIGANAVVNGEVPDFSVAVGNPVKILKRKDQ
jgi:acetyltransferase-like isoleucine patch superfamily enzyme